MKPRAPMRFTIDTILVFGVALVLRGLHLWQLRASPFLEVRLGDAATYDKWARGIAAGDWLGSEVFFQAPLYPYLLGAIYATLGDEPRVVRGVQCLLSALACALLASAGARLFSRGAGLAAGLLLATYAPSIFLDALLQKSVLDVFFLCLALWLGAGIVRDPTPRRALGLGLAVGLLALARENALILAGVLLVWLATLGSRRWLLAGAFAAGLAAALVPVTLRNWWVGGELHLTTSQAGLNLYLGNHAGASGLYQPFEGNRGVESERQDARAAAERALGRPLSAGEVSDYWTGRALDYVRSQPGDWLLLMGRKAVLLASATELVDAEDQYTTAEYSRVLRAAGVLGHFGVLAPLAVLGVFVAWPRRRELWWIFAATGAYTASVLIFYVVARYRYPLVPFLALLAGAGLAGARGWWARNGAREAVACGALMLALALVSNGVAGMSRAQMAAITHLNLAHALRLDGRAEAAASHYREALALDPGLEDASEALRSLGRSGDEILAHERALAARPREPRLHARLADLLRARGDTERASEHYRRALELAPGDREARRALAELHAESAAVLLRRGDAAAALAGFREALKVDAEAMPALWGAAWILATQSDPALRGPVEALALAERAVSGSAALTPRMLETLAAAHAAAGQQGPALARAREAEARYAAAGRPAPRRLVDAIAVYERGEALMLGARDPLEAGP